MAASTKRQEEEEEYLAPRGVPGQVRRDGRVRRYRDKHTPHTLSKSFCLQALQGLYDYRCKSAAAVLDRAQVEGAVAVLRALLLLFSALRPAARSTRVTQQMLSAVLFNADRKSSCGSSLVTAASA